MKCPHCGYDKIQPNFNYCPRCKRPLKDQGKADKVVNAPDQQPEQLGHHGRERLCIADDDIERMTPDKTASIVDWDACPRCGRYRNPMPRPFEDPDHCPNCGAAYPVFTHEVRELRKNQTREELIEQLKDISSHWVNAPFAIHKNAMCYSIAPPHEDYVKCEECGKVVEISNYLNNQRSLERIVQEINELGYDASIKGLCKECAEKKGIEPMLLSRDSHFGETDNGQYFHLFAFKTKEQSEYTYSITNDTLDYCVLEAFLENKTTFEFDEKIIRVSYELPIIQMMSGITLPDVDINSLKEQIQKLAYERTPQGKAEMKKKISDWWSELRSELRKEGDKAAGVNIDTSIRTDSREDEDVNRNEAQSKLQESSVKRLMDLMKSLSPKKKS